jgi:hypothetical protein
MKAWADYAPAGEKAARDHPVQSRASVEPDIVMILAGMALSCTKGGGDAG